ncbi:hypothetical protein PAXRUDRAFT_170293 [Paxillus rubicundulus Ve08.2h10]|uniref:Retrotransposon Copia-like N-terminal domain-containing protein n=1 Tax=Paxillus rubicundulus Ve08.2h10 TaxID=930991 RepID=A0A0D0CYL7_9AGAM|nr:hypothetical protein PAXRUDRAFT_170293 [Paxillus rubicundulus Ve08.2h10]
MSSNTASTDTTTCLTLISPSNFQIWKLQITAKLQREKVLGVALGTDTFSPSLSGSLTISGTATGEKVRKWMEWNERVHGIIQDSISDALLLKTEMHTTAKDLFNALLSIHQVSSLASAFYIFQQLFNSALSGGSAISKHITLL